MAEVDLNGARVLITGGAGFIGSHIADLALAAGAGRLVVLDDLSRGSAANLREAMRSGRAELHEGDICNRKLVSELTAGADIVFHQAAMRITQCAEAPARAIAVMAHGTQNVLDAALQHRVRRVVSASSASVYGEPSYLPMDEAHPLNSGTLYGDLKIANEELHRRYAVENGLSYLMLRPFNVYGPRMDTHGAYTEVMIRWLDRLASGEPPIIFGDGRQTMDFVGVNDVARAYLLAATGDATGVVLNAGTGVSTSLRELAATLCEVTGNAGIAPVFAPARAVNGVGQRRAATSAAQAVIGFQATTSLREGLVDLAAWHRAQALAGAHA